MLHWLALHSDLTVTERHRHSFDPFPDSERRVPFGTGATLLDGIFDLKVTNGTTVDHQFRLRFTDTHLMGELRAAERPTVRYEVVERDHRFVRQGGEVFRDNRIVRLGYPLGDGLGAGPGSQPVSEAELFANHCRVGYPVDDDQIS
jgi:vancomycin resistance protein VanW